MPFLCYLQWPTHTTLSTARRSLPSSAISVASHARARCYECRTGTSISNALHAKVSDSGFTMIYEPIFQSSVLTCSHKPNASDLWTWLHQKLQKRAGFAFAQKKKKNTISVNPGTARTTIMYSFVSEALSKSFMHAVSSDPWIWKTETWYYYDTDSNLDICV